MMTLSSQRTRWILLAVIFAAGFIVRVAFFGSVPPSGLLNDEAYAGYEAFSLGTYGIDSDGYPNPVYFLAWGSGMNVLESYLAIPFVKLLGCTAVAIRLPQLILGLITLPFFYLLTRKVFSESVALVATALLALCPWHVMMCRWALESNLAPAFYLLGLYFLVKGTKDSRFWLLSALFFGVGLYAYAIMWALAPLTVLFCGIYLFAKWSSLEGFRWPWLIGAVILLFLLALPLILFLLVNRDIIPEIITPVLSIPHLTVMRIGEFSLANVATPESWGTALSLFLGLCDPWIWNSLPEFGIFYYLSVPFIVLGLVVLSIRVAKGCRTEACINLKVLVLIAAAVSFFVCLMTHESNVNKSNCMHMFSLIFAAVGVVWLCRIVAKKGVGPSRILGGAVCAAYVAYACAFCVYYFTEYSEIEWVATKFNAGLDDALDWIEESVPSNARVATDADYPNILYFTQVPTREYVGTVRYFEAEAAFRYPERFGRYVFAYPDEDDPARDCVYLYENRPEWLTFFQEQGFQVLEFGSCFVAVYPEG